MLNKDLCHFCGSPFNSFIQTSHVLIISCGDICILIQQELKNVQTTIPAGNMKGCIVISVFLFQRAWQKRTKQSLGCFQRATFHGPMQWCEMMSVLSGDVSTIGNQEFASTPEIKPTENKSRQCMPYRDN